MISLRWSRAHCDFSAPVSRAIVISPPRLVWDCDFSATPGLWAPPSDAGSARAGGAPAGDCDFSARPRGRARGGPPEKSQSAVPPRQASPRPREDVILPSGVSPRPVLPRASPHARARGPVRRNHNRPQAPTGAARKNHKNCDFSPRLPWGRGLGLE